jgi:hypothetical protein
MVGSHLYNGGMNTKTITTRLETLSAKASSAMARGLPTEIYAVGMRQILEAHPKVRRARTWHEIAAMY